MRTQAWIGCFLHWRDMAHLRPEQLIIILRPNMPKKPAEDSAPLDPTRVRAALQHFLELAVAFEGGGVEVVEVGATDARAKSEAEAALECLKAVVSTLEEHLAKQRELQRMALAASLHIDAAALFTKLAKNPAHLDLDAATEALAASRGMTAGEGLLDALVIAKHELKGGPSATAAKNLGELAGVSGRTLFTYKSDGGTGALRRTAWGRWVPVGLCSAYVKMALEVLPSAPPTLDQLRELPVAVHRRLDALAEAEYRRQVEQMFEAVLLGDLEQLDDADCGPALEKVRQQRLALVEVVRARVMAARVESAKSAGEDAAVEAEIEKELRALAGSLAQQALRAAGVG